MDECTNERMNKYRNEWMNEQTKKRAKALKELKYIYKGRRPIA